MDVDCQDCENCKEERAGIQCDPDECHPGLPCGQ